MTNQPENAPDDETPASNKKAAFGMSAVTSDEPEAPERR